jgi:hypothetical protein
VNPTKVATLRTVPQAEVLGVLCGDWKVATVNWKSVRLTVSIWNAETREIAGHYL